MPLKFTNLFSTRKLSYIKKLKDINECILCEILKGSKNVTRLLVAETELAAICVNKFPYNSAHLMIFPKRHIVDYREMSDAEKKEIDILLTKSLDIIDELYSPCGYNIGYNLGDFSGASIKHIHLHLVPRYKNELGFIDIIGGAKIIVEDPTITMKRLREKFKLELK